MSEKLAINHKKCKENKLGKQGKIIGIVDIGSNTIRFNIYQVTTQKRALLFTKKTFAGLSSYIENHVLHKSGVKKVVKTLNNFGQVFHAFNVDEVFVFATAALRNVNNSIEVVKSIYEQTGIEVHVLTGKEESKMDYFGACLEVDVKDSYIIDIGGGSTEVITCQNSNYSDGFSIPYGSLNLYKQHVNAIFPTRTEAIQIRHLIRKELENSPLKRLNMTTLYGIGGTIRASGNLISELYYTDNHKYFSKEHLNHLIDGYINQEGKVLKTALQVAPDRLHTQTVGMLILDEVMAYLNIHDVHVLKKGIRDGYLDTVLKQYY
ncbi:MULTISPECIES: hypothetical protein [unclassified Granulicatella]|uniref:Ppx/GppA phosphatase family protein n=1 Tax=unclassified Granulicatella TaxID=2630493 RepID=UPI0010746C95|nr:MULTISPECIES: hypothetical protein [unclassified Granulicatella]MBF0779774.1 hypothetical protein [Granulicatella sp. 19428wC4_WM01]TFU96176.1 hypothetical protein E4T68_01580 [Granulicatella sp. WM01]